MRSLSFDEQKDLCAELRERIISVVLENGGHLASNLGVVELTVGMYNVFDPFYDRIVWDVGHQTYVHKILTGRNGKFDTLRREGGLSGFPKRSESEADAFNTGHSSTSISAAVGFARAAKITGENRASVAVIGDGAFTGGQAFEALNDAAGHDDRVIIVLNDNGMSISKNVGGLARYLGRMRTRTTYIKLKKGVKKVLSAIPRIGTKLVKKIQKIKLSFKLLLIPGELFELLDCVYIGPIDGHNVQAVTEAMKKASNVTDKPCVVHVITKKGQGYKPAEDMPEKFHGVAEEKKTAPARSETCKTTDDDQEKKSPQTLEPSNSYSEVFASTVCDLASKDDKVVAVSAAMTLGTKLEMFKEKYPDRFFDVGIAEQHAVTLAAGLSFGGVKPYLVLYSTFAQRAYDQLLHDAALQQAKIIIGFDRGGAAGRDGETHQGIYDLAYAKTLPSGTVFAPSSLAELSAVIRFSYGIFENKIPAGPFIIRYPAKNDFTEREEVAKIEYGKGEVIKDTEKKDIALIAIGSVVNAAVEASERLEKSGFGVALLNARFAKPIDLKGIRELVRDASVIVTIEDGIVTGGFGETVVSELAQVVEDGKNILTGKKIRCLGYPDEPVLQADIRSIYKKYGLDADGIVKAAAELSEHVK